MPAGAGGNEHALIKGRPAIVVEQASQVGTIGDITLCDLRWYIIIDGGIASAISADVSFLNDQTVFRFVLRVDGAPAFTSPITPYLGATTRSPFVALAAR
jgi:HK97 family phage major capsid protein